MFTSIDDGVGGSGSDTLTHLYLNGNNFAEGTCLPGDLASVANERLRRRQSGSLPSGRRFVKAKYTVRVGNPGPHG